MILKRFAPIDQYPLELVDLPIPEPDSGAILLRVKVCGVCHTDLHTIEGELPEVKLAIIPGHQVVGVVTQLERASSMSLLFHNLLACLILSTQLWIQYLYKGFPENEIFEHAQH